MVVFVVDLVVVDYDVNIDGDVGRRRQSRTSHSWQWLKEVGKALQWCVSHVEPGIT